MNYSAFMKSISEEFQRLLSIWRSGEPFPDVRVSSKEKHFVWSEYVRTGMVSEENELILEKMLTDMAQAVRHLYIGCDLSLRFSQVNMGVFLEDFSEEEIDSLTDWVIRGGRSTDTGIPKLLMHLMDAYRARSPEARLQAMDKAFHVTHWYNDLCSFLLEGGSLTAGEPIAA